MPTSDDVWDRFIELGHDGTGPIVPADSLPQWGAEGSRQATTDLLKTLRKLTSADLGALDAGMRVDAANVLRRVKKDPNTSAAHLNYLKILSTSGIDGLKKALKDPNQLVPVLAMLGMGSTLVSRQSGLEPDEQ